MRNCKSYPRSMLERTCGSKSLCRCCLQLCGIAIFLFLWSSTLSANDHLKVATFNINWGNVNLPDIKRVILLSKADIICIQESNAVSERYFRQQLNSVYRYMSFKGHLGKFGAERFGFLSKRPLKEITFSPPVHGFFGTYSAVFTHQKRSIKIVNVHLSPFFIRKGSSLLQAMQAISAVENAHKKEMETVCNNLKANQPTFVVGDFNSHSALSAPKQLQAIGFADSFASVTKNADANPTWSWPVGKFRITYRIDYVFHSSHFETVDSKIIPTKGSDHALVVSEFQWKKDRAKSEDNSKAEP